MEALVCAIHPPLTAPKTALSSLRLLVICPQEPGVTAGLLRGTRGHNFNIFNDKSKLRLWIEDFVENHLCKLRVILR